MNVFRIVFQTLVLVFLMFVLQLLTSNLPGPRAFLSFLSAGAYFPFATGVITMLHRAQAACVLVSIIVIAMLWPDWQVPVIVAFLGPQAVGILAGGLAYALLAEANRE